ncbi:MAG: ankyrin repeat domain-containing protein [Candidatus Aminicenantales bacterium]
MKKLVILALAALLLLFVSLSWSFGEYEDFRTVFNNGDSAKILEMLAADPQLLKTDMEEGMTPLHSGVYLGLDSVVDYTLKHGLDLTMKDRRGLTPVWFAVSGGRPAMLRKLIALGANLSIKNADGENMLFRAARAQNAEIVDILLEHGFKIDEKAPNNMSLMDYAFMGGSIDIAKLLVAKGMKLDPAADGPIPMLIRAALSRNADGVHFLLDQGFDIDVRNIENGRTALLMAVDFGNRDGARALAMRGANVNAVDKEGMTPLSIAVEKGDAELVDLFLKKGARLDAADPRTGKTVLHEAALRGYSGVVETLLARGIDKNAKDKDGRTALSYALKYGNKTAADILRAAGVKDVPWETNLDDSVFLNKALKKGEAFVWYLRHSGWAIKTASAILVFDYWDNDPAPDEKLLANGHVRPEELKGLPVYVFVSHEHGDHFDPQIFNWRKTIPNITYIFGFEPGAGEGIVSLGPRVQKTIGPLEIATIKANDAGVGFAVNVDGLTIFHAGDHSNNKVEVADNDFFPEIDFLAGKGIRPDIAFFLNLYGCGSSNPEAFQKGIFYAVDNLKIKSVLPMHGANKEWGYAALAEGAIKNNINVQVGVAVNQGDRFFFQKGKLTR